VSAPESVELFSTFIALFTVLVWHPILLEITFFVFLLKL